MLRRLSWRALGIVLLVPAPLTTVHAAQTWCVYSGVPVGTQCPNGESVEFCVLCDAAQAGCPPRPAWNVWGKDCRYFQCTLVSSNCATCPAGDLMYVKSADDGVTHCNVPVDDGLDNDGDGKIDEEICDGLDNDGDGRIDEDTYSGWLNGISTTGVDAGAVPGRIELTIVGANPSHDHIVYQLAIPRDMVVDVALYDVNGRMVAGVLNGALSAGLHPMVWTRPAEVQNGVFFLALHAEGVRQARKVVLLR